MLKSITCTKLQFCLEQKIMKMGQSSKMSKNCQLIGTRFKTCTSNNNLKVDRRCIMHIGLAWFILVQKIKK